MNDFEKRLLNCTRYKGNIKLWVRCVDDILVIWEGSIEEIELFVKEVNTKEKNIQFKEEIGDKNLNYLDIAIHIKDNKKLEFDIFRKETYSDTIIPKKSYHPYRYKLVAINAFCYRAQKCLKDKERKERELKKIKRIVKNNNYNMDIVDKVMESIEKQKDVEQKEEKKYLGSVTYIGTQTRKTVVLSEVWSGCSNKKV